MDMVFQRIKQMIDRHEHADGILHGQCFGIKRLKRLEGVLNVFDGDPRRQPEG